MVDTPLVLTEFILFMLPREVGEASVTVTTQMKELGEVGGAAGPRRQTSGASTAVL